MRQKHYYFFGEEMQKKMQGNVLNENNWNLLRNDDVDGPFSIEKTIETYEANCMRAISYHEAANIIVEELKIFGGGVDKVISLGAGKGILEWHIKKACPELIVECTDYAVEAIEKLKKVFIGMDAGYTFDILNGDYKSIDGDNSTILMYRVSTEFNREQWYDIFEDMYTGGINNIIYVPAGLESKKEMYNEQIRHIMNRLRGRRDIFCGWLYSEDEFLKMFCGNKKRELYNIIKKIPFENTAIYFLSRNKI